MELLRTHETLNCAKNERVHADLWYSDETGYKVVINFEIEGIQVATVTITDQRRCFEVWQDIVS